MGLSHIVITSVDRDDLPDGGASQFVKVIEALRRTTPGTTIEILTPDFLKCAPSALELVVEGAHAAMMQHVVPEIVDRVNRFFGYSAVARVRLRQGEAWLPAG